MTPPLSANLAQSSLTHAEHSTSAEKKAGKTSESPKQVLQNYPTSGAWCSGGQFQTLAQDPLPPDIHTVLTSPLT